MSDRWVCKRCYADNDGDAVSCVRCGLTRGAEVSANDQAAWQTSAAATAHARPQSPWQRLLRFWWIPGLAVLLIGGYFFSAGQRALQNLQVGQCFDASEAAQISEVDAKDCGQPHEYEVFHVVSWPNPNDAYPSESTQNTFLMGECLPVFASYIGKSYQTSIFEVYLITPTEGSWREGDREFVCAAYDPGGGPMTGSVRNTGR